MDNNIKGVIVVYTIPNCPKCKKIVDKLAERGIQFRIQEVDEKIVEELINDGFEETPVLDLGDQKLTFVQAIKWLRNYKD